jgi:hypothetical protein
VEVFVFARFIQAKGKTKSLREQDPRVVELENHSLADTKSPKSCVHGEARGNDGKIDPIRLLDNRTITKDKGIFLRMKRLMEVYTPLKGRIWT